MRDIFQRRLVILMNSERIKWSSLLHLAEAETLGAGSRWQQRKQPRGAIDFKRVVLPGYQGISRGARVSRGSFDFWPGTDTRA